MSNKILLSIVIATCNRQRQLINCLKSLHNVFKEKNIEIIIIDQSDTSLQIILKKLFRKIIYKYSKIKNASNARNYGSKLARGTFIWFLDDDAKVINFNLQILNKKKKIFFISWKEKKNIFKSNYFYYKLDIVRMSGTPFYVINKKDFLSIGGFNTLLGPGSNIGGGEDLDFLLRLNKIFKIKDFEFCGSISHSLCILSDKKRILYYKARGYVLGLNREYVLFFLNFIYDILVSYKYGIKRVIFLVSGFFNVIRHK
jgi:glycosyltransferase involved in cell wall biosynthesis